ncbi:MAG: hypothetical protein AB1486_04750 [Planctomycetota bacterium]
MTLFLLGVLVLPSCRATRGAAEPIPPAASQGRTVPLPQVVLTPAAGDLRAAPGGPVVTMTERERKEFFRARAPVFEPIPEPQRAPPEYQPRRESWMSRITDFPLFYTLSYGALGAIIGNQFDGANAEGAAIGAGIGLMRDSIKWGE